MEVGRIMKDKNAFIHVAGLLGILGYFGPTALGQCGSAHTGGCESACYPDSNNIYWLTCRDCRRDDFKQDWEGLFVSSTCMHYAPPGESVACTGACQTDEPSPRTCRNTQVALQARCVDGSTRLQILRLCCASPPS